MLLTDLSTSQRYLLIQVLAAPDGLLVENRSTAAASLVRKGFATKILSRRKPPEGDQSGAYQAGCVGGRLRGQLAELRLTEAGLAWLNKFEHATETAESDT